MAERELPRWRGLAGAFAVVVLLSFALLSSAMARPAVALAAEDDIASGTWGTCPWTINADGVLRIGAGTGADTGGTSAWGAAVDMSQVVLSIEVDPGAVAPGDCSGLFARMRALKSADLSNLDVSGTTDMSGMFHACESLETVMVVGWRTERVTTTDSMFYACAKLQTLDLSSFETPALVNARYMFGECGALRELDLGQFDVSGVTDGNLESFFFHSPALSRIRLGQHSCYAGDDAELVASPDISANMPWKSEADDAAGTRFTSWSSLMQDAASSDEPRWYTRLGTDIATGENGTCTWSIDENRTLTIKPTTGNQGDLGTANTYGVRGWWTYSNDIVAVKIEEGVKAQAGSLASMFYGESNLTSVDLSGLDASNATTMDYMFANCTSLQELDLSGFDTSSVTRMYYVLNPSFVD